MAGKASLDRVTQSENQKKKLPRLPKNARVTKRPLLRPPIPSPRSGSSQPKVIYVSARTAFIPVIKGVEKLLALAETRTIQSATTTVQKDRKSRERYGKRKPTGASNAGDDELLEIAQAAAMRRNADGKDMSEEVVIKGTGRAVQKVLDFGLWFQQREDRFIVNLRTGSVGAIDDIEIPDHDADETNTEAQGDLTERKAAEGFRSPDDSSQAKQDGEMAHTTDELATQGETDENTTEKRSEAATASIPETRVHYTSSLEVFVRLR